MTATERLRCRNYGTSGPLVYVLHGGPAAVGTVAPIAKGLAEEFRVIEPFQKGSSLIPLTVAEHVADLDRLIQANKDAIRPFVVGHSWGAMLALAYAATHPDRARGIVLVGCGTFDQVSRDRMNATISQRVDERTRAILAELPGAYPDLGDRLRAKYDLIEKVYDYDTDELPMETSDIQQFDMKAHTETWNDMLRLQENKTYPQAFAAIVAPVLMLHGSFDPHPGKPIYESLKPYIRRIEYVEIDRCGHDPWRERLARERFFAKMTSWMTNCAAETPSET